jgi:hypothetical protein
MAKTRPILVAIFCCSSGILPAAMDIKIILSTPRTISRKLRVKRLNQTAELEKSGMVSKYIIAINLKIVLKIGKQ